MTSLAVKVCCLAIVASLAVPTAHAQTDKPNVVVMMVDNHGWGELGCYGGGILRGAPTPRLDQLAEEGMRLLNFNVEPQCTPSRSAFMTGRHPIRSGTDRVVWGMLYGMTGWEKTMAELFSDAGYATGMFGKWHLGDVKGRYPTDQGFDEFYGVLNTTDESEYSSQFQYDPESLTAPQIRMGRRGEELKNVKPYDVPARREIDAELTRRSIDFMKRSVDAKKPFFAFVPFTQPHLPTLPHPDFDGKTGNGHYADVTTEIDYRVRTDPGCDRRSGNSRQHDCRLDERQRSGVLLSLARDRRSVAR